MAEKGTIELQMKARLTNTLYHFKINGISLMNNVS